MQNYLNQIYLLLKRFSVLLLIYSVLRLLFYVFNSHFFPFPFFTSILPTFILGLRFDISAIIYTNLIFLVLHTLPIPLFYNRYYQKILFILFYTCNIPFIIINCVDLGYFQFILKRTTWDLFNTLGLSKDFFVLLPSMIRDFWYLICIAFFLVFLMIKLYRTIKLPVYTKIKSKKYIILNMLTFVGLLACIVIGSRGGLQYRPINLLNAAQYSNPANAPLILNSSFSIIKSIGKVELEMKKYFTDNQLKNIYQTHHYPQPDSAFKNYNVVLIIMESFSKEFTSLANLNGVSYTPFLDSLSKHSLVCINAFANGKKSIDGVPSVLAGLPSLMNESYITSAYSGNQINSLANLLKVKGYHTSFFHGGINGTMGFDGFAKMAGFDYYYGKSEYPNPSDYDGDWGIYDEPYFQYYNAMLSKMKEPFFSSIFTISSHHPYNIPENLKSKFPEEKHPIYRSVKYADYALQKFFMSAKKEKWFNNTLFVITSDHTSPGEAPFYQNQVGAFAIPLLFYMPSNNLKGTVKATTQQLDIMPTVLDFLNYDKSYFSFGSSIFSNNAPRFSINYSNGIYQLISNPYSLQFDGERFIALYEFENDASLSNNILSQKNKSIPSLQNLTKAIVQTYNNSMIQNKTTIK